MFKSLHKRFDYIFEIENKYPGAPTIDEIEIDATSRFEIGGKTVIPIEAYHNTIPVLGFRIEDFTYLTDVKTMSASEMEKLKGTKVLVVNALRESPHHSHFNLSEALAFIEKIKPEKAYLTHISHLMGFHEEVSKQLPKNVFLAYDTLQLEI